MRWYAETPRRWALQLTADLLAVLWTVAAVLVGVALHDALGALQRPAGALADAGGRVATTFGDAARTAGDVPFVGDRLARAFDPGIGAGTSLARAGQDYGDAVGTLAVVAGLLVPVLLLFPVLLGWLPLRLRYARRAGAAVAARSADPDLLALRALVRTPLHRLRSVGPDPVTGWRESDPDVLHRLAAVELGAVGLRPPPERPEPVDTSEPSEDEPDP